MTPTTVYEVVLSEAAMTVTSPGVPIVKSERGALTLDGR
jgi:hypothetical protein